jgi:phospholipase/carboxylesterase
VNAADPHAGTPVHHAGKPLGEAAVAVVLLHGRGATAESILTLANELHREDAVFLAPQASEQTWYPHAFLAPLEMNEPWLSSALRRVYRVVSEAEAAGIPRERIVVAGFSQGACLAAEFVARNAARWGGLVVLSGGLIGTADTEGAPPENKRFDYPGHLDGTPVLVGCSDFDPHIPIRRVEQTVVVFSEMKAEVDGRVYEGLGHAVNRDEMDAFDALLRNVPSPSPAPHA